MMISSAKQNGAGLVKFQLYNAEDDKKEPHYEWVKKAELTFDQAKELFDYGASIGMEVFFSIFGVKYMDWCEKIGVKRYKIACGMRDKEILKAIKNTGKELIISTAGTPEDIASVTSFDEIMEHNIKWLYCPPGYPSNPVKLSQVNFGYYGLSDHSIGLDASKIAISRGAQIIEKHFILDRSIPSPESPWSMTPSELAELVRWEKVCQESL